MNLGEFHTEVESCLARGSSLTAVVPGYVRRAARWLERNYTFQYMKQFLDLYIDLDVASTPRYIELGIGAPKKISFLRWRLSTGEYQNLERVEPEDLTALTTGTPDGFWLDGIRRLVLNKTPDENLTGELRIDRYTPWPTQLTFQHWLLDQAEDVLLAQTLVLMAPRLRDPRMVQTYEKMRDEGLKTLLLAEDELQYGGMSDKMLFTAAR